MILKCENCGKEWVHNREYAVISPYCSYGCAHRSQYEQYKKEAYRREDTRKAYRLTVEERKRQELIEHPEFLEID